MKETIIVHTEYFIDIRKRNNYYVDKTSFIEEFLETYSDVTLFTRPRRFGKTLLMDMLAEFFDISKKSDGLFEGLEIYYNKALCAQWMNKYPVISISFKEVVGDSFNDSLQRMQMVISEFIDKHKYLLTSNKVSSSNRRMLTNIYNNTYNQSEIKNLCVY